MPVLKATEEEHHGPIRWDETHTIHVGWGARQWSLEGSQCGLTGVGKSWRRQAEIAASCISSDLEVVLERDLSVPEILVAMEPTLVRYKDSGTLEPEFRQRLLEATKEAYGPKRYEADIGLTISATTTKLTPKEVEDALSSPRYDPTLWSIEEQEEASRPIPTMKREIAALIEDRGGGDPQRAILDFLIPHAQHKDEACELLSRMIHADTTARSLREIHSAPLEELSGILDKDLEGLTLFMTESTKPSGPPERAAAGWSSYRVRKDDLETAIGILDGTIPDLPYQRGCILDAVQDGRSDLSVEEYARRPEGPPGPTGKRLRGMAALKHLHRHFGGGEWRRLDVRHAEGDMRLCEREESMALDDFARKKGYRKEKGRVAGRASPRGGAWER